MTKKARVLITTEPYRAVNTSFRISLTLAVFATAIIGCQPQQGGNAKQAQTGASDASSASYNIAVINNDSLLSKYEYFLDVQDELERKGRENQRTFQQRGAKFQRDMQGFQQRMEAGLLSRNEAESEQTKLMAEEQALQKLQNTIQLDLMQRQADYTKKVSAKIDSFLTVYNQDKGYDLILNYVPQTTVWLLNDQKIPDITQEVVEGLNKEYQQEQKAKEAN